MLAEALGGPVLEILKSLARDLFDSKWFLWSLLSDLWDEGSVKASKSQFFCRR